MSNGTWSSTPFVPGTTNGPAAGSFAAWEESMMDEEEV